MHQSLEGPLQTCVFYIDRNSKMTTTGGHSFYIEPIGSFYNQVNDTSSWEPLVFSTQSLSPLGIGFLCPFGFLAPKDFLIYLVFQCFDLEHTWWKFLQGNTIFVLQCARHFTFMYMYYFLKAYAFWYICLNCRNMRIRRRFTEFNNLSVGGIFYIAYLLN